MLINVTDLTFAYDGTHDNIFQNASFQLDTDWRLGFVGRNGRGKTTFLKLLCGKYEYSGVISANVDFEYFPFDVPNADENTLDILTELCEAPLWELSRELNLLDFNENALYRPFSTLSNGERTKALLAALFLRRGAFLLIDEPTNHLDYEARQLVGEYLRSKKGFILVSHDRTFLDSCVDHILSINRSGIEVRKCDFSGWMREYERQCETELAQNERLKGEIKRLDASARKNSDWSDKLERTKHGVRNSGLRPDRGHIGAKAAKLMQRSKNIKDRRQEAIDEKTSLLKNIERADELKLSPLRYHSKTLVELADTRVLRDGNPVCPAVSFTVERGERIALRGRNGSGKSSLLKLICGESLEYEGRVSIGSGLTISYVAQDTSALCGTPAEYAAAVGIDQSMYFTLLRKLDLGRAQFEKDMRDFSCGQKKKALLAASLCSQAHLYIWDEPLNFIDVFSRMQIEQLLTDCEAALSKAALLFVEHDKAFCDAVSTRIIQL